MRNPDQSNKRESGPDEGAEPNGPTKPDTFTENLEPSDDTVLEDNATPGSQPVISQGPELSPHDKVRKHLALAIMWSLLAIYAATIGIFLWDKLTDNRINETALTTTVAAISGLQGLGAAIVGFYFGVQEKNGK